MKKISLTQGKCALVDDEDYDYLIQWKWHTVHQKGLWYAYRSRIYKPRQMHRVITKAQEGQIPDHIDGNGLNNQKYNLRMCAHTQNLQNQKAYKENTSSKYKGVSWNKFHKRWKAVINNKRQIHLGLFQTEEIAARAYDEKAVELFGEFARTNFPRRIPHARRN